MRQTYHNPTKIVAVGKATLKSDQVLTTFQSRATILLSDEREHLLILNHKSVPKESVRLRLAKTDVILGKEASK